jgi:hypothetical protein
MYDRIKEMVRKLKSNATILQYLEREFGCCWRLAIWLPANSAYYDINILCDSENKSDVYIFDKLYNTHFHFSILSPCVNQLCAHCALWLHVTYLCEYFDKNIK